MEEIKITQYKAIDGTIFDDVKQCLEYDNELEEKRKKAYLMQYAKEIKIHCEGNENCKNCPFALNYACALDFQPCEWELE